MKGGVKGLKEAAIDTAKNVGHTGLAVTNAGLDITKTAANTAARTAEIVGDKGTKILNITGDVAADMTEATGKAAAELTTSTGRAASQGIDTLGTDVLGKEGLLSETAKGSAIITKEAALATSHLTKNSANIINEVLKLIHSPLSGAYNIGKHRLEEKQRLKKLMDDYDKVNSKETQDISEELDKIKKLKSIISMALSLPIHTSIKTFFTKQAKDVNNIESKLLTKHNDELIHKIDKKLELLFETYETVNQKPMEGKAQVLQNIKDNIKLFSEVRQDLKIVLQAKRGIFYKDMYPVKRDYEKAIEKMENSSPPAPK